MMVWQGVQHETEIIRASHAALVQFRVKANVVLQEALNHYGTPEIIYTDQGNWYNAERRHFSYDEQTPDAVWIAGLPNLQDVA